MKDIYFDENYGKIYEKVEHGEAVVFKCKTENGEIINDRMLQRNSTYNSLLLVWEK